MKLEGLRAASFVIATVAAAFSVHDHPGGASWVSNVKARRPPPLDHCGNALARDRCRT